LNPADSAANAAGTLEIASHSKKNDGNGFVQPGKLPVGE